MSDDREFYRRMYIAAQHELRAANERIQQLEDRIERASRVFFHDGSDRQTAAGMLSILEEERTKR